MGTSCAQPPSLLPRSPGQAAMRHRGDPPAQIGLYQTHPTALTAPSWTGSTMFTELTAKTWARGENLAWNATASTRSGVRGGGPRRWRDERPQMGTHRLAWAREAGEGSHHWRDAPPPPVDPATDRPLQPVHSGRGRAQCLKLCLSVRTEAARSARSGMTAGMTIRTPRIPHAA